MRFGFPVSLVLLAIPVSLAQDQDLRIHVSADLVQVDAVVTGHHREHVNSLTKDDFELFLDGQPQKITHFVYVDRPSSSVKTAVPQQDRSRDAHASLPAMPPVPLRPDQVKRTVALFVDDLSLSAESVSFVRKGLRDVIENELSPGDLSAVVRASAGMGALQDFTTDKRRLLAAAEQVHWNPVGRGQLGAYELITNRRPLIEEHPEDEHYRTRVFTMAAVNSLRRVIDGMADLPGRKAAIVLSDRLPLAFRQTRDDPKSGQSVTTYDSEGDSIASEMRRCVDAAARSGVVIYAIDTRGLSTLRAGAADNLDNPGRFSLPASGLSPASTGDGRASSPLVPVPETKPGDFVTAATEDRRESHDENQAGGFFLASQTGGLMIGETNNIGASIRQVYSDLNGYYVLGFRPPDDTFERSSDGRIKFHHIVVRIKPSGLHVRSRSGFFGRRDENAGPRPERAQLQLAANLESPFRSTGVGLDMHCSFIKAKGRESLIDVSLFVNAHDLSLSGPAINRSATIHLLLRVYGLNGADLEGGIDKLLRVSLNEEGYERASKYGLVYSTTIAAGKPGPYEVRAALLDVSSGKVGTANELVYIPKIGPRDLVLSGIVFQGLLGKEDDITPATGLRTFSRGETVPFAFEIFGTGDRARLTSKTRLFRDGVLVASGQEMPLKTSAKSGTGRLFSGSAITIPQDAAPGDYFLQVIVADKGNARVVWQWTSLKVE